MKPERLYLLSDLATTPRLGIGKHYPLTFYGRRDGNLDLYRGTLGKQKHSVVTVEEAEKSLLRLQRTLRSMFEVIEARLKSIDDYFGVVSAFEAEAEEEEREEQGD